MSLTAGTVFEMRSGGSPTNGAGFYDANPGTSVDYSQQDAAALSLSDISVSGTAVTSVTGGFTAAMEGNVIYLTGGGATVGWYQITAYTDTNTITIDSSGGTGTNTTGNVGGAWDFGSTLEDEFFEKIIGDDCVLWVKGDGAYTLTENVSVTNDASWANRSFIKGYNTTRGDDPVGSNRPEWDFGTYYMNFTSANYVDVSNIIFDVGSANGYFDPGGGNSTIKNCKLYDSTDTKNYNLTSPGSGTWINCEFVGTSSFASTTSLITCSTGTGHFISCYFHGSGRGINSTGTTIRVWNCVFDGLDTGCYGGASSGSLAPYLCTFYNCGVGLFNYIYTNAPVVNNVFQGNTTAIQWNTTDYGNGQVHGCCFYGNTTDVTNGDTESTCIFVDPKLVDPANGDFTLDSGSPCFDAGISLGTHVGLAV